MRDAQAIAKINKAVKACVEAACDSPNPLATLMRYVDVHRDSGDWSHDELAEFERAVLLILRRLHEQPGA
jgi:hypothetical protein